MKLFPLYSLDQGTIVTFSKLLHSPHFSAFIAHDRCMAVKSTPVQHEEVDFADMCARLQHQLSTVEGQMSAKFNEQTEKYESTIRSLKDQVIIFLIRASSVIIFFKYYTVLMHVDSLRRWTRGAISQPFKSWCSGKSLTVCSHVLFGRQFDMG
jgi:hypothetical protein